MIRMQHFILHPNHALFALGRCILRPFRAIFRFILASVHMVMVYVCTLFKHPSVTLRAPFSLRAAEFLHDVHSSLAPGL